MSVEEFNIATIPPGFFKLPGESVLIKKSAVTGLGFVAATPERPWSSYKYGVHSSGVHPAMPQYVVITVDGGKQYWATGWNLDQAIAAIREAG